VIRKQCGVIQEGDAILFFMNNLQLGGYVIIGAIAGPTQKAKIDGWKVWNYFVNNVVKDKDIYCSLMVAQEDNVFGRLMKFHASVNGTKIYKLDKSVKDKYSRVFTHLKGIPNG